MMNSDKILMNLGTKVHLIGALAQLGERLPCTQEVSGSIPLGSTIKKTQTPSGVFLIACKELSFLWRIYLLKGQLCMQKEEN